MPKLKTKLFVVTGCHAPCPNRGEKLTKGYGYATDYFCKAVTDNSGEHPLIDGYVEWESEMRKPGDFPKFCPLKGGPRRDTSMEKQDASQKKPTR